MYKTGAVPVDIGGELPIAVVPEDPSVEKADLAASPVSLIPEDSPARVAVRELAERIRGMAGER
jgi:CO dehydrogenase maturation factor